MTIMIDARRLHVRKCVCAGSPHNRTNTDATSACPRRAVSGLLHVGAKSSPQPTPPTP